MKRRLRLEVPNNIYIYIYICVAVCMYSIRMYVCMYACMHNAQVCMYVFADFRMSDPTLPKDLIIRALGSGTGLGVVPGKGPQSMNHPWNGNRSSP